MSIRFSGVRVFAQLMCAIALLGFPLKSIADDCDKMSGDCEPAANLQIVLPERLGICETHGAFGSLTTEKGSPRKTSTIPVPDFIRNSEDCPVDKVGVWCGYYAAIVCPSKKMTYKIRCTLSSPVLAELPEGSGLSYMCPGTLRRDKNLCGNSAGDPFDVLTGEQQDFFDDLKAGSTGLSIRRALTTVDDPDNGQTPLTVRQTWPTLTPWYSPFGAGWTWSYGFFLAFETIDKAPIAFLADNDGLRKVFRKRPGSSRWENTDGAGSILAVGDTLVLHRGDGEIVTFKYAAMYAYHIWRPIRIEKPAIHFVAQLTYMPEPNHYLVSEITTNTGASLKIDWSTGGGFGINPKANPLYSNTGPYAWINQRILKITVRKDGIDRHTIDYTYNLIGIPDTGTSIWQVAGVTVDNLLRWEYENQILTRNGYSIPFVIKAHRYRGEGKRDTTTFKWGVPRGTSVTAADGKTYYSTDISWTQAGSQLVSTIKSAQTRDPNDPTKISVWKSQTQVYDQLAIAKTGGSNHSPVSIDGPGCKTCGSKAPEKYIYETTNGRLKSKCDADGVATDYGYDHWGNVISTTTGSENPICPRPSYIVGGAQTVSTTSRYGNEEALSKSTSTSRPSVAPSGGLAGTVTDFDLPETDLTPLDESNFQVAANDSTASALPQAEVQFGLTWQIGVSTVEQVQITRHVYRADGYEIVGPLAGQRTNVTYYPGTSLVQYRDVYLAEGACPGQACLRTTYLNYDELGNPTIVIDPNGIRTTYSFNEWNKTTQIVLSTPAGDLTTQMYYDLAGDLKSVVLPEGNVVDYEYIADGLLWKIQRRNFVGGPILDEVDYEYDPQGNRTGEKRYRGASANGGVLTSSTAWLFDQYDHVQELTNGVGATKHSAYSPSGLLLSSQDEAGNTTSFLYDSLKRLAVVRSPDLGETHYQYDTNSNLVSISSCRVSGCDMSAGSTDPNLVITRHYYDDFGRLVVSISPDAGISQFEYDKAGNLVKKADTRGVVSYYEYDAANRLTSVRYEGTNLFTEYFYDQYPGSENAIGRLAAAKDDEGITILSYDFAGRLVREARQSGYEEGAAQSVITRVLDNNGNVRTITYPSGITVQYDPSSADIDRAGAVRLQTPQGETVLASNISFDPGNLLKSFDLGNGLSSSIARDLALRTTQLYSGTGGNKVVDRTFSYFLNGNVKTIIDNTRVTTDQSFTYDPANRLASATGAYGQLTWTYDTMGNRLTELGGGKIDNYNYAAQSDRLDTVIDPPLGTATTSPNITPGAKQAALVQINNQLLDLFFSGERFMSQTLGIGSFSESQSAAKRFPNDNASSPYSLFVRKATDTTELLKAALADGRVTLAEVKAAALADTRLQDTIDQFFADLRTIPTDQATPFVRQFFGLFSLTDLLLLNQVLDLASQLGLPPIPGGDTGGGTGGGGGGGPEPAIVALSNETDNPEADAEWRGIVDDVRQVAHLGKAPSLNHFLSGSQAPDETDQVVRANIDDIKARYDRLSAQGVSPARIVNTAAGDEALNDALLSLGVAAAPSLGASNSSSDGLFATLAVGTEILDLVFEFGYDQVGNATSINRRGNTINYVYGADNRLRQAGSAEYSYDYLGRRVAASYSQVLSTLPGLPTTLGTVSERWSYDTNGDVLRWSKRESASETSSRTVEENYIYLAGTRLAKFVITTTYANIDTSGGTGGGGGCCCASTAIAFDGKAQCDFASRHALQVLRGFRAQVLSGTALGEQIIRFYYHDLSRAVVPVLREYPELRHGLNYALRAAAWVLEFWVKPAFAEVISDTSYQLYYYHNGLLGEPIALTDANGKIVRHVEHDPFWAYERTYVADVDDRMRFPGQFMDATSGLVYNWNRWYSPEIGRYVEDDPLIANGMTGLEAYAYASDNPLNAIDPWGLIVKRCKRALHMPGGQTAYGISGPHIPLYHEFLEINGQSFGFGPTNGGMFNVAGGVEGGDQSNDCQLVTCVDENKLSAAVGASSGTCMNYNFLTSNCQDWVKRMLDSARIHNGPDPVNKVCCQ